MLDTLTLTYHDIRADDGKIYGDRPIVLADSNALAYKISTPEQVYFGTIEAAGELRHIVESINASRASAGSREITNLMAFMSEFTFVRMTAGDVAALGPGPFYISEFRSMFGTEADALGVAYAALEDVRAMECAWRYDGI